MIKKAKAAANSRITRFSTDYLNRQLILPFFSASEDGTYYWKDLFHEAGVELCEPLKVDGSRGIFRVKHPDYGQCVLKGVFTTRAPQAGMSQLMTAQIMSECPSPIFPKIYVATPVYTLEEYIDGWDFRDWISQSFDLPCFDRYVGDLREWGRKPMPGLDKKFLSPCEVRDICRKSLKKCINHLKFFSPYSNIEGLVLLYMGIDISEIGKWIANESNYVNIESGKMCGDLGNINVKVDHKSGKMFNIDYEYISKGNWAFDISYLISSLNKMGDNEKLIIKMKKSFLNNYIYGERERQFFEVYTDMLSILSASIYGRYERARRIYSKGYGDF